MYMKTMKMWKGQLTEKVDKNIHIYKFTYFRRVHKIDPKGRFRDSYYYNDLMYGIIAKISEDISSRQWEDMVTTEILSRLGMTSTNFFTSPTFNPLLQDVAQGYVKDNAALYPVSYEFLR